MQPSRKIVRNVLITAFRMLATVCLGLLATRLILAHLGDKNFGLYALILGGVSLVSLVNGGLQTSTKRYLAFEIGRGNMDRTSAVFSTAAAASFGFALLLLAVGIAAWPLFLAAVRIPPERVATAHIVWLIMLGVTALRFCLLSVDALFPAHQDLGILAAFEAGRTVFRLLIALLLPFVPLDPVIGLVSLLAASQIVNGGIQIATARWKYPEIHWQRSKVEAGLLRNLLGFGSWQLVETSAQRVMRQGGVLILNRFFGVTANAAFSLATQLRGYMDRGAAVIINATHPAIISTYAAGRHDRASRLANLNSSANVLVMSLLAVPLLLETNIVVNLWIPDPPALAVPFVRILIIASAAERLSLGYASLMAAHGRLRVYSSVLAVAAILSIPVVYWLSAEPLLIATALPWCLVLLAIIATVFRIVYVGRLTGANWVSWLREVLFPVSTSIGIGLMLCLVLRHTVAHPMIRLGLTVAGYAVPACIAGWFLLLRREERQSVLSTITDWKTSNS